MRAKLRVVGRRAWRSEFETGKGHFSPHVEAESARLSILAMRPAESFRSACRQGTRRVATNDEHGDARIFAEPSGVDTWDPSGREGFCCRVRRAFGVDGACASWGGESRVRYRRFPR
jgi:hypothetical protein